LVSVLSLARKKTGKQAMVEVGTVHPTYEAQKGKYPFVAEHIDVVSGWLDGDFRPSEYSSNIIGG
jgi:hypothetical protein